MPMATVSDAVSGGASQEPLITPAEAESWMDAEAAKAEHSDHEEHVFHDHCDHFESLNFDKIMSHLWMVSENCRMGSLCHPDKSAGAAQGRHRKVKSCGPRQGRRERGTVLAANQAGSRTNQPGFGRINYCL